MWVKLTTIRPVHTLRFFTIYLLDFFVSRFYLPQHKMKKKKQKKCKLKIFIILLLVVVFSVKLVAYESY
jgi:hypothetical protein